MVTIAIPNDYNAPFRDLPWIPNVAATIGTFDGVHFGHRFLLDQLKKMATEKHLPTMVITFDVPPISVVRPGTAYQKLTTIGEKLLRLEAEGVDYTVVLPFTPELVAMTADTFITTILHKRLHVKALLVGYDHRFGHGRISGLEEYKRIAAPLGITVKKASQAEIGGVPASSSAVRQALINNNLALANQLLGYDYILTGKVEHGFRIGRELGFPTANLTVSDSHKLIPCDGVYAVRAIVSGKRYNGMLYIGRRPTLNNGDQRTIEVNLFDFDKTIYGSQIRVEFVAFIREDMKFDSLEALRQQIQADYGRISALFESEQSEYSE